MKTLILQYDIHPKHYPDFYSGKINIGQTPNYVKNYSKHSFEKYAEKFGHDFKIVTEPKINYGHPTWERFDLWYSDHWFEEYDQICYVDTDVFALPWAPDIFSYDTSESFKKCPYWKFTDKRDKNIFDQFIKENPSYKDADHARFCEAGLQAGVFILTKKTVEKTIQYLENWKEKVESGFFMFRSAHLLNYAIIMSDIEIYNLPVNFNLKYAGNYSDLNNKDIYFSHAFGRHKDNKNSKLKLDLQKVFGHIDF